MIFCPGGGYGYVAIDEPRRRQLADAFASAGIAVFVLKYLDQYGIEDISRTSAGRRGTCRTAGAQPVREMGAEPASHRSDRRQRGANLTLHVCAKFDTGDPVAVDPIARESARPDFGGLLACWAFSSVINPYPLTKETPPMFICHAYDDKTAPTALSEDINAQLTQLGIAVSFNQYAKGGHGAFNLATALPASHWPELLIPWLQAQGLLR